MHSQYEYTPQRPDLIAADHITSPAFLMKFVQSEANIFCLFSFLDF